MNLSHDYQYVKQEQINTYDEICRTLTNYENGSDDEQDLYELLVWLQNNWDFITGSNC